MCVCLHTRMDIREKLCFLLSHFYKGSGNLIRISMFIYQEILPSDTSCQPNVFLEEIVMLELSQHLI